MTQWLPRRYNVFLGYGNGRIYVAGGPGCRPQQVRLTGKRDTDEAVGLGGLDAGETDQGEREADEVQGRLRGSGAIAGRQERP